MKKKERHQKITLEFCRFTLHVYWTSKSPVEFVNTTLQEDFPELGPIDGPFTAVHIESEYYKRTSIVILPSNANDGIRLHELTHAVDHIIEYFGFEGTEIRAYILEYFFNETT